MEDIGPKLKALEDQRTALKAVHTEELAEHIGELFQGLINITPYNGYKVIIDTGMSSDTINGEITFFADGYNFKSLVRNWATRHFNSLDELLVYIKDKAELFLARERLYRALIVALTESGCFKIVKHQKDSIHIVSINNDKGFTIYIKPTSISAVIKTPNLHTSETTSILHESDDQLMNDLGKILGCEFRGFPLSLVSQRWIKTAKKKAPDLHKLENSSELNQFIIDNHHTMEVWCIPNKSDWQKEILGTRLSLTDEYLRIKSDDICRYLGFHAVQPPNRSRPPIWNKVVMAQSARERAKLEAELPQLSVKQQRK